MRRYWLYLMVIWAMQAIPCNAQSFCFAFAESYYEQVYCQLQARAQTKGLPPFHEFKKNNEQVQAALLKRPAERNAIKLPLPKKSLPVAAVPNNPQEPLKRPAPVNPSLSQSTKTAARVGPAEPVAATGRISTPGLDTQCRLQTNTLMCGDLSYQLLGNQANSRLKAGVLEAANKMALPEHRGEPLNHYLSGAYAQYIRKMCEIGLCGVTMSYGKFAYLYQDVQSKGLNFSQRFETMFGFLKKDKASLGVSEALPATTGLILEQCAPLADDLVVCPLASRNLVFVRR